MVETFCPSTLLIKSAAIIFPLAGEDFVTSLT